MININDLFDSGNMDFGTTTGDVTGLGVGDYSGNTSTSEIKAVDYLSIIEKAPNFISLDISVNSTGWAKWLNGELTYGTYSLVEESELERRQEFKRFLKTLYGDDTFEFTCVEDTIGSCSYRVLKYLVQLNSIVDDMAYDRIINAGNIVRIDNKVWKKHLHKACGIQTSITKCKDKMLIVECMNALNFTKSILPDSVKHSGLVEATHEEAVKQDVYDALGIAVGVIARDFLGIGSKKAKKLKDDIRKGYKIKQFSGGVELLSSATTLSIKKKKEIVELDFKNISRDLVYNFKKAVNEHGEDKLYCVTVPTSKLGVIAIEKDLSLDNELSYLLVYR